MNDAVAGDVSARGSDPSTHGRASAPDVRWATIRLADALRAADLLRMRLDALRAAEGRSEDAARLLRRAIATRLAAGLGSCRLARPAAARLVEECLLALHGRRARLLAWSVAPNHAHAVFEAPKAPPRKVVAAWKRGAARRLNALDGAAGGVFSRDDGDRRLRDGDETARAIAYVEAVGPPFEAPFEGDDPPRTSRRFRGPDGALDVAAMAAAAAAARAALGLKS